ncbi:hypothetical protein ScFU1_12980 [Streptococcus canis]|nr:hypothetical protein ScFU1_12980 [Streptococcus canis]
MKEFQPINQAVVVSGSSAIYLSEVGPTVMMVLCALEKQDIVYEAMTKLELSGHIERLTIDQQGFCLVQSQSF